MHFVPTLYKNHSSYKICIIKQVVMKIFSVPLCFCLFYYIICDFKFVRSFDEDPKSSNQTSGDTKQSRDSQQRANRDDALKQREENERNCGNSQKNYSNQQSAPPVASGVTHTPTTKNPVTPESQESNNLSNSKSPKLIDLDIKKKEGKAEFNWSEKGNVVTYTPKEGYGFGTVKKSKGSCNCTGSDKVIWEAENGSKHSNKVVIETSSDKQKTLTIHSVDGTTAVYKESKGGDFTVQNDDSSKNSKPGGSSAVTHTPTDKPTSEEDRGVSQTPDSTARVFGNSPNTANNYPHDSKRHDSSPSGHDGNRERR